MAHRIRQDHFYVCQGHLKDKGFASPVVDEAEAAAKRKKEELDREIEVIKKEYEEKLKKKKSKDKKDKKEKDKGKDDDKKGEDEDEKAEKEKDAKVRFTYATQGCHRVDKVTRSRPSMTKSLQSLQMTHHVSTPFRSMITFPRYQN